MSDEYGDFADTTSEEVGPSGSAEAPIRVKLPRNKEIIGIVVQRLGGNRMEVQCTDGKLRNCRVPGRFKRSMWLRPKDHVLVEPWEFDNTKADIVFQYNPNAVNQLRKRGLLANLHVDF